jgi:Alcohol dehydrogenase, class IV
MSYSLPHNVSFSNMDKLMELITQYDDNDAVIILSENGAERWGLKDTIEKMRKLCWIKCAVKEPTQADILRCIAEIPFRPDVIIAIGGGSSIDLAKGISAMYGLGCESVDDVTSFLVSKKYIKNEFIDIVAVPSTAGTGSELTQWATIWDVDRKNKYSVDASGLRPKIAFIVPELTLSSSQRLTLATALDAISHAMEAFWSVHSNSSVQNTALSSAKLISESLPKVLGDPQNLEYRTAMCEGSVLSAVAFSQTRTAACHAISYPLTMTYGIEHGFAVALTLNEIMAINGKAVPRMNELENIFTEYGGFEKWLSGVCGNIVSLKLSSFGAKVEDLQTLASSIGIERMVNNPVKLTQDDVCEILKKIF